jgi:hypothetical protein
VVDKIPTIEGNLLTFRLICYFCLGKKIILAALYKRISNEQAAAGTTHTNFNVTWQILVNIKLIDQKKI